MTIALEPVVWTAVDLAERFGPIPMNRICTAPPPGLATEEDAIELNERRIGRYELVDGILVEKATGAYESMLGLEIGRLLKTWVKARNLGTVLGADGMLRLAPGLIRIPDVAFLSIEKFPGGRFPREAAVPLAPDVAVEVLSATNTEKEMTDKLQDYFAAGTRLVWFFDAKKRQVQVFTSPESSRIIAQDGMLDGGDVLPGFQLSLKELFAELPPE